MIGYCVAARCWRPRWALCGADRETRVRSVTFFTTQVDFTYAGDLKVFVDEDQISALERAMGYKATSKARRWRRPSTMLRSCDLISGPTSSTTTCAEKSRCLRPLNWNSDFDPDERGEPLLLPAQAATWRTISANGA